MLGSTLRMAAAAALLALAPAAWAQDAAPAPAAVPAVAEPAAAPAVAAPAAAPTVTMADPTPDSASAATPVEVPLSPYQRMAPTPGVGQPDGGWDLQEAFTPIAVEGRSMAHHVLDPIMVGISLFVLGLLGWVMFRYRASRNPVPSKTTHNFTIEVIWTVVPALILVFIAVPSFRLLANQYDPPRADVTVKVTGHQWYWSYEYPDYGDISFDSLPLGEKDIKAGDGPLHLEVDNRLVVPAGAVVKVLVTSADVGHAWAVPSFWVKMDAWPGRINETWFKTDRPGVYYGQCSELCGTKHAFMPIAVEVLPREQFLNWVRLKQREGGITPTGPGIAAAAPAAATPVAASTPAVAPAAAPVATTAAPAAPAAA